MTDPNASTNHTTGDAPDTPDAADTPDIPTTPPPGTVAANDDAADAGESIPALQSTPAPEAELPPSKPQIRVETSEGSFALELEPEAAPHTVDNFLQLVHDGFYDGLTFHRIIPTFIIQAGCPHGDGTGGPGYTLDAEFNDIPHEPGTISMARTADPNSAGSQFFICLDRTHCKHLDGEYTAFGRVVSGMDTINRIAELPLAHPDLGVPEHAPMILHICEVYDDDDEHAADVDTSTDTPTDSLASSDGAVESDIQPDAEHH